MWIDDDQGKASSLPWMPNRVSKSLQDFHNYYECHCKKKIVVSKSFLMWIMIRNQTIRSPIEKYGNPCENQNIVLRSPCQKWGVNVSYCVIHPSLILALALLPFSFRILYTEVDMYLRTVHSALRNSAIIAIKSLYEMVA